MTSRPELVWVDGQHQTRLGAIRRRETWVYAEVGDGVWTVGYRVETIAGAPVVAEQRQWPTGLPPWRDRELHLEVTTPEAPPSLDLANRALSPRGALAFWREECEMTSDFGGEVFSQFPAEYGFDPMAPPLARAGDGYYLAVAEKYVSLRRDGGGLHGRLAGEFGVSEAQSRKLVMRCRERGLLNGDELGSYALGLRQHKQAA